MNTIHDLAALVGMVDAHIALQALPADPDAEQHRADLARAMGWECVAAGCTQPSRAGAMCDTHYRMLRRQLTDARTCEVCGATYTRAKNTSHVQHAKSRYCSRACACKAASAAKDAARREAVIEDLEVIIGTDAPDRIAARLGYANADGLVKALRRWGRDDLAAHLTPEQVAA